VSVLQFSGFDWDSGNWPKCGKHGVSCEEIEEMLLGKPMMGKDPYPHEPRLRAVGKAQSGRYIFVAFVFRCIDGINKVRPLSARYMHEKEVMRYAETKKIPHMENR